MSQALINRIAHLEREVQALRTQLLRVQDALERLPADLETTYQRKRGRKAHGETQETH